MIDPTDIWQIILALMAFSALVFVHELGHYLAARFVGVRVERFFIGFDAWGLSLKKEYKGCVYGIGILPLGGYVKLAGQSDDPRDTTRSTAPDELPNKSLLAQGLVYVAGVTMNIIFGFLLMAGAYLYGIPFSPNVVGSVANNSPASASGLQTGDRIIAIDGTEINNFEDLQQHVAMNPGKVLTFTVDRPVAGSETPERMKFQVRGEASNFRGHITQTGIQPAIDRVVWEVEDESKVGKKETSTGDIKAGDIITSFNGRDIPDQFHGQWIIDELISLPGKKNVPVTLLRNGKTITTTVNIGGSGFYSFGASIFAQCEDITPKSPAEDSGLKSGDKIAAIEVNGKKHWLLGSQDLIQATQKASLQPVELTFVRDGQVHTSTVTPRFMGYDLRIPAGEDTFLGLLAEPATQGFIITKVLDDGPCGTTLSQGDLLTHIAGNSLEPKQSLGSQVDKYSTAEMKLFISGKDEPVQIKPSLSAQTGIPRIGIVLSNSRVISRVEPGSIADKAGLLAGFSLTSIDLSSNMTKTTIEWTTSTGTPGKVTIDTPEEVIKNPSAHNLTGYLPLAFKHAREERKISHIIPALKQAAEETLNTSLMIYNLIHKIASGRIRIDAAGGPVLMFRALKVYSGEEGGSFARFIAMISINLAVINILPFPVLDGGHVLFLVIEGLYILIMRKRPNEKAMGRIKEVAQYIGVFCLLALVLTMTSFDLYYWISGKG